MDPKHINSHNQALASENSVPAIQEYGNQGRDLDEEIREIDTELGFFEEPQNSRYTEIAMSLHVSLQPFNMEKLKNVLAPNQALPETPLREELSHRSHTTPPHDVNN